MACDLLYFESVWIVEPRFLFLIEIELSLKNILSANPHTIVLTPPL